MIKRRLFRALLVVAALAIGALYLLGFTGHGEPAHAATPDFRIVDIRAEYGHMIVEVEHFDATGDFWFYELYTFQGREGNKHAIALDAQNRPLLADGTPAPERPRFGAMEFYRPPGKEWKRAVTPAMENESITRVIQKIHNQRLITGWTKGQERITASPLDPTPADTAWVHALLAKFSPLVLTSYRQDEQGALAFMDYSGPGGPRAPPLQTVWGTVSVFFSDTDPESTSVDGDATYLDAGGLDWSVIHGQATGTDAVDDPPLIDISVRADGNTDKFDLMIRGIALFDTSAIGSAAIVSAADLDFVVATGQFGNDFTSSVHLGLSSPASNTAISTADFDAFTATDQATALTLAGLTVDSATFNTFTLNTAGKASIDIDGITKFSLRISDDFLDVEPTWASGEFSRLGIPSADEDIAGDKRPFLTVTHTSPAAAITGTIGDGATEQEVRDGAGTIIMLRRGKG